MPACILIVENNEANLNLVRHLLQHRGYATLAAVDGNAGVEMAHVELPRALLRRTRLRKHVAHDEILELRIGARARGHRHGAVPRQPNKIAGDVVANDRDHLADDGDPDIAVGALSDLDQLLRVTTDILVQAEVVEVR